jgi:HK97 family phage portal protein
MSATARRQFVVEYQSGVAQAEAMGAGASGRKNIIGANGALDAWSSYSRENGDNFRTNTVTYAEWQDYGGSHEGRVLGLATSWACVNLLAGTQASLPLMVYRENGSGERTVAPDHPLYRVLHDSPNADQTALDFWEFVCVCLELWGNAYSEVSRRNDGSVIALAPPLAPRAVTPRRNANGDIEYAVSDSRGRRVVASADMLHIRGFGGDPLGGLSTLAFGRQVFGLSLSVEGAATQTFRNGVRPSGVLTIDKALTAEQREKAEQLLQEKYRGTVNAGVPMLLDNGLSWTSISMNPEDAQMLESRRFSVEEICRFFGVPPHMIGHTENSTSWGTGLEQQTLGFQKFTLRRRLKRIEQALEKQLLTPKDRSQGVTVEFSLEGLLRGDSAARVAFYGGMSRIGAMTINEIRALENLPPVEGGDVPRMQMQNIPITEAQGINGGGNAPA